MRLPFREGQAVGIGSIHAGKVHSLRFITAVLLYPE